MSWIGYYSEEELVVMPAEERAAFEELLERERYRQGLIEKAVADADWDSALMLTESEGRAHILLRAAESLSDEQARDLLAEWWSSTEAWQGDPELRRGMMALLQRAAPVTVDPNGTLPSSSTLTVYRGNMGERPGAGSWTLDLDTAERFASGAFGLRARYIFNIEPGPDDRPTVWRGVIARDRVLGYFDDRGEREVVIGFAPYELTKIREAT